jgi:ligand-binding sensor domain-containing protein
MWIGGAALQRYDGYRFKNYFNGNENRVVVCLLEDSSRQIWAGTDKGLYHFNRQLDRFDLFADSVLVNQKRQKLVVTNMVCDKEGNLWLACASYYAFVAKNGNRVTDVSANLNHPGNSQAYSLSISRNNTLWVQNPSQYGIVCYDISQKKVYHHFYNPGNNPVFDLPLKNMNCHNDPDGNLWMNDGFDTRILYRYHWETKKLYSYKLKAPPHFKKNAIAAPGNMIVDKKGRFWIQLNEHFGLARYNAGKDAFEYLFVDKNKENGLYDDFLVANPSLGFYIDRTGNIWHGGDGVNLLSPDQQYFVSNNGEVENGKEGGVKKLQSTPSGFVHMNDGHYYGAYYGDGLWQLDSAFNLARRIELPENAHSMIWQVFSADGETLFWGDQFMQLFKMNIRDKVVRQVDETVFGLKHLNAVFAENKETVWLGHVTKGLSKFNPKTFKTVNYPVSLLPDSVNLFKLSDIEPEGKNELWLSYENAGIHLFDKTLGRITKSWYPNPNKKSDAGENGVFSIERLNADTLLLCTNVGFLIWNTKTQGSTLLGINDGLPDNRCYSSLIENNKKYVWINTQNKGICRLNLQTLSATGFPANEGNTGLYGDLFSTRLSDGRFLFSNSAGFTILNPNDFSSNKTAPAVTITELWINNRSVNLDSVFTNGNPIEIQPGTNRIKIKFSALNFWQSGNMQYQVKINDADTWTDLDNMSEVDYLNLPPGNYHFSFRATYPDGSADNTITALRFHIQAPFYKTNGFLVFCGTALALLLYGFYRWRIAEAGKQAIMKQKIAETETQALRAQMNPHFIFNSLNSIENFMMRNERRLASDYLNKFSKLIRNILDSSRNELVPVAKDLEALQLYIDLEQLRFNNKFSYKTVIDPELINGDYRIPSLLIQPYVENAIIHGIAHSDAAGLALTVTANLYGDSIKYSIQDNGIGRQKAAAYNRENKPYHKSVGLSITKDRIVYFNGPKFAGEPVTITDLYDAGGEPCGTKVDILIKTG